jgi:hypothetical protein
MSEAIQLPDGVLEPTGNRITQMSVRGIGPILVDEIYEDFCKRFQAFMEAEHARGDQFHYTAFYSWKAEVNRLHQLHVKTVPGCLTLDGCRDVTEITVGYMTVDPIEIKPQSGIVAPAPFAIHGQGKRR